MRRVYLPCSWSSRNSFQFFMFEYDVSCGLFIGGLYCVEVPSFYSYFVDSFYYARVLSFVKHIFCTYWDQCVIFILYSVNVLYQIHYFCRLKHLCVTGKNPNQVGFFLTKILVYDPFNVPLNLGLWRFCWRFLHLSSLWILACSFDSQWWFCLNLVSG